MKLVNQRIILTGGTAGVGRALVDQLARDNQLLVIGRSESKLAELRAAYPGIETKCCDLADLAAVWVLADDLASRKASWDLLLCNAAVQLETELADPVFSWAATKAEIALNFSSIVLLVSRLLPSLQRAEKGGTVALVNSGLALAPKRSSAVYCATKAALRSLGLSLGYQLDGTGVRVVQAYLPLVETAMTAGRGADKISAAEAATGIVDGIVAGRPEHFIGQTRWLHRIYSFSPALARRILHKA